MRHSVLLLVLLLGIAGIPASATMPLHAQTVGTPIVSANLLAQDQPSKSYHVDINIGHSAAGRWYASPLWIAIGVLA
jgi:hypothetical protein